MKRENDFLEAYRALDKLKATRESAALAKHEAKVKSHDNFLQEYYAIQDRKENRVKSHRALVEAARNDALSTAIKAIYITALEADTLTDNGVILAENMVDSWIKESGGAHTILSKCKDKTYLLNRIASIVEDAAEEEVEDAENLDKEDKKDTEEKKEDSKKDESDDEEKDSEEKKEDKKDSEEDDEKPEEDEDEDDMPEEPIEDEDPEEDDSDDDSEDDGEKDPLQDVTFDDDEEIPDDATTTEDDNETDVADDIVDDLEKVPDKDLTVDGTDENRGKIFDELEKEEDVQKAIQLIRQRVADAEETFIRRNAEDKKQIDEIIGRISDNVKTVEDMDDPDYEESKIAEESARLNRRRIKNITENRKLSVLERMSRNLTAGIMKDQAIREQYTDENGKMDISAAFESAKVMYGFLETLNTLQLENVNAKYIQEVIDQM